MTDPHDVLGLPRDAGEADVRKRYLELVRRHPPDRAPERFAEIRAAYEALRDPVARLQSQLFDLTSQDSMPAIVAEVAGRIRAARLPTDMLLSLADSR